MSQVPSHQIVVPIRVEAKYLEDDTQVTPPLADFSKLPWNNGTEDINFDQPNVSDGVIHEPFEKGLILGKGLHLHFILPHFLGKQYPTTSENNAHGKVMPAAPNRWLITKVGSPAPNQWLIQSDYVYDPSEKSSEPTCIIPYNDSSTGASNTPPYRYMGKKIEFSNAKLDDPTFDNSFKKLNGSNNAKPLTVAGYGDINFSSFYPNCKGVFGFHDGALLPIGDETITYQIVGWVDDGEDDFLSQSVANLVSKLSAENAKAPKKKPPEKELTPTELFEKLNKEIKRLYGVELAGVNSTDDLNLGGKTLYYSRLTVQVSGGKVTSKQAKPGSANLKMAVGQTGTEALSALTAHHLSQQGTDVIGSGNTISQAKEIIEEQLESILMLSKIDHLKVDVGPKFREARHEKGFKASHSGHLWKVKSENTPQLSQNTKEPNIPPLPAHVALLLNDLNMAQVAYDKAVHEIVTLREQLYQDWVKYMHARYPMVEGRGQFPDADHIQYFIKNFSFPELEQLISSTGQISYGQTENKHVQPEAPHAAAGTLAYQLVTAWNALHGFLATINKERASKDQPNLFLTMIAGPRFWEAKAPTVLFSGLTSETAPQDTLTCQVTDLCFTMPYSAEVLPDISANIAALASGDYLYSLEGQAWNPFIMDWAVDLVDTHLRHNDGSFNAQGLQNNFDFNTTDPDFHKNSANYKTGNLSVFSGSVMMSSHAKHGLLKNLTKYFIATLDKERIQYNTGKCLGDFLPFTIPVSWEISKDNTGATPATDWSTALEALDLSALRSSAKEFKTGFVVDNISNPFFTAWMTCKQIADNHVISQTLDGFNEASVMKKKVGQFPIAEPIGFDYEQDFTSKVKTYVQNQRHSSPVMAFQFNPVRSGGFSLDRLSLVDNFGTIYEVDTSTIETVASETLKDQNGNTFLKPRLAQPARLNLRWHAANPVSGSTTGIGMDTNDSPETSPICGWLMVNYLNNEIAVYDSAGGALGYISWPYKPGSKPNERGKTDHKYSATTKGVWNTVPWSNKVCDLNTNVPNRHLQAVVEQLLSTTNTTHGATTCFLDDFRTATQHALDNISPTTANIYSIKSILMGRPMAVVRSRISYELKGKPVISQSWSSLLTDLNNCNAQPSWTYDDRNRDNWTDVLLPCKLGEYRQLNDGLVGYWVEDMNGSLGSTFFSPEMQTGDVTDSAIQGLNNTVFPTQWIVPNSAPMNMTMLMDPRGLLHATTGLLPTKAISIPPEHYLPAMQKIEMWFRTTPILQPATNDNTTVPLDMPSIKGYTWQWWDAFQGLKDVSGHDHIKHQHSASKVIEGWLSLIPNENESK